MFFSKTRHKSQNHYPTKGSFNLRPLQTTEYFNQAYQLPSMVQNLGSVSTEDWYTPGNNSGRSTADLVMQNVPDGNGGTKRMQFLVVGSVQQ